MKYNYANNKFYEWGGKNWGTSATLEGKDYFNNFVFERKKKSCHLYNPKISEIDQPAEVCL